MVESNIGDRSGFAAPQAMDLRTAFNSELKTSPEMQNAISVIRRWLLSPDAVTAYHSTKSWYHPPHSFIERFISLEGPQNTLLSMKASRGETDDYFNAEWLDPNENKTGFISWGGTHLGNIDTGIAYLDDKTFKNRRKKPWLESGGFWCFGHGTAYGFSPSTQEDIETYTTLLNEAQVSRKLMAKAKKYFRTDTGVHEMYDITYSDETPPAQLALPSRWIPGIGNNFIRKLLSR